MRHGKKESSSKRDIPTKARELIREGALSAMRKGEHIEPKFRESLLRRLGIEGVDDRMLVRTR